MRRFFLLPVFALYLNVCRTQTLAGTWHCTTKPSIFSFLTLSSFEDILEIEVSADSVINGIVHSYFTKGRYTHVKVTGQINWKDSLVVLDYIQVLDHNINTKTWGFCYGIEHLTLSGSGDEYIMTGKWKDKSPEFLRCPTQKLVWRKPFISDVQKEQKASITERVTDIQRLIEIDPDELDSIQCSLYDNGEIDNDTVSVYFDNLLIVDKQRLSGKPIVFYISVKKARVNHTIRLYAENMGAIPPNTAVLILTTRKNRYVANLTSDLSKNGTVHLFLKD